LKDWAASHDVQLPHIPAHCSQAYHMFYMLLPKLELRQELIAHLNQRGILSVFHYLPLHLSEMGLRFGGHRGDCPVSERVSDLIIRLPFYNSLTCDDQQRVVESILDYNF
jgi:dTDP-4-amino-4,6-dideoxygalactose transaminase